MLLFCLLCAGLPAFTQTISGVVHDSSDAVIPGAQVTLRSPDGKALAHTQSHTDGTFHLNAKPGKQTIEIRHDGFKPFRSQLNVAPGGTKPVVAVLEIQDLSQQMEVNATAGADHVSVDPAENRDAAVVSDRSLEKLPVFDQDYVSTLSTFLDQSSIGTMGTTIVVDGMEQKDAGVTPSAVQNVKINNDPYSAEYSRPGKGRIEITTKTPDSVYHGTFNFIFRDYHLDARNAFASTRPVEQRRIFEGSLTGPLWKSKKTFFLLSGDYQQDNLQSIVYAQLPTQLLQENVPSPAVAKDLAARLLHNFNDTHTLTLQMTYEGASKLNQLSPPGSMAIAAANPSTAGTAQTQVLGGFVLPEAGRNRSSLERHLTLSDKLVLSPTLINQLQLMYEHNRNSTAGNSDAPQINVQNSFVSGGAQATQLATENNADFRDTLTYSHQAHTITGGVAIPNMSRRALDDYVNRSGTYNFASLSDYINQQPYSFTQQRGPSHFVYWQKEIGWFVQDQWRASANLQVTLGVRWDWQNYIDDNHNFAPRASIAYAFGPKRDYVVRAGSGFFNDRTSSGPIGNLALYSQPSVYSIQLLNPAYPNPFIDGVSPAMQPFNIYRFNPRLRTPYIIMYSVALEHQLTKTSTVAATYRGSVGVSLFESLNINQPYPPLYNVRPFANYGVYQQIQSSGRQVSQALDLSFSGKIGHYLSGMAQYTYSHTYNNTSGINYMPPNTYDLSGEWGRSDYDQHQRLSLLMTSSLYKWVDLGVGVTAASGLPYTWTLGQDIYNSGFANARPPGVPRNSLQGPGYMELDLRWSHDFAFTPKKDKGPVATIAVDAFNL
ncbi:MAG TPA: TonB-dependent receptor, partial [Bryobacteraceae bacterium]|nr:TonB-dependent receptor [Bryobacteraceae bacterium]